MPTTRGSHAAARPAARQRAAPASAQRPATAPRRRPAPSRRDGAATGVRPAREGQGVYGRSLLESPPEKKRKRGDGDKGRAKRWAAAAAQAGADRAASATLDDGWKSYSHGNGPSKRHKLSSPGGTEYSKTAGQKKHDQRRLEADPAQTLLHTAAATAAAELTFGGPIDRREQRGLVTGPNRTTASVPDGQPQPTPAGIAMMDLQAVDKLVVAVNSQRRCADRSCDGDLVPCASQAGGLGGAVKITYQCNGSCGAEPIVFDGTGGAIHLVAHPPKLSYDSKTLTMTSSPHPDAAYASFRSKVGLSYAISYLLSGKNFADYFKQLNALGVPAPYNRQTFLDLVKYMLPFTRTVLEEEIRAAEHWHRMDESFHKLILTGDGVWQSKKFSKNGSYIVNDYELDGALLAYAHACQKGECDGDTEVHWDGTSKAMEGHLAGVCYNEIKKRGGTAVTVWLDGDASSDKEVSAIFPDAKMMRCFGHAMRALDKSCVKASTKKAPTEADVNRTPFLRGKACSCERGKKQVTKAFILHLKISLFTAAKRAGVSQDEFEDLVHMVTRHVTGVCTDDGQPPCDFHPQRVCLGEDAGCDNSCPTHICLGPPLCVLDCDPGDLKCKSQFGCYGTPQEPQCAGVTYTPGDSHVVNDCDYHVAVLEQLLQQIADRKAELIDPDSGRGQTNFSESRFSVLPRYRDKATALQAPHYCAMTNIGLLEGNRVAVALHFKWITEPWEIRLMKLMELPISPQHVQTAGEKLRTALAAHTRRQTPEYKQSVTAMKVNRSADAEKRKRYEPTHTYGQTDDGDDIGSDEDGGTSLDPSDDSPDLDGLRDEDGDGTEADSNTQPVVSTGSAAAAAQAVPSDSHWVSGAAMTDFYPLCGKRVLTFAIDSEATGFSTYLEDIIALGATAALMDVPERRTGASQTAAAASASSSDQAAAAAHSPSISAWEAGAVIAVIPDEDDESGPHPFWLAYVDETAKQRRKTFPVTWLETDDGTAYKLGTSNRINTAVVICEVRATGAWDRGDDSLTLGPEEVAVVTAEIERQHEAAEAAAAESDDGSGEEPEEQAEEEGEERCATWPTDVTITAPTFDEIVNTIQILTPKITELTGITQAQVEAAEKFPVVWDAMLRWMRAARDEVNPDAIVILGHNLKKYDLPLAARQGQSENIDVFTCLADIGVDAVIDTLDISAVYLRAEVNGARLHPQYNPMKPAEGAEEARPSDRQGDIYQHLFNRPMLAAHTALGDATALLEIVKTDEYSGAIGHHSASLAVTLAQHEVRERVLRENWVDEQGGYGRDDRGRCERVTGHHLARAESNKPSGDSMYRKFSCARSSVPHPDVPGQRCGCAFSTKLPRIRVGYTSPVIPGAPKLKATGTRKACMCTTQCATAACPCFPGLCGPACHLGLGAGAGKCCNSTTGRAAKATERKAAKEARVAAKAAAEAAGAALGPAAGLGAAAAAGAESS